MLLKHGYEFTFTDETVDYIVARSKSKGMGARPILREISTLIEDKLIDLLAKNDGHSTAIEAKFDGEDIIIISDRGALIT